MDSEEVAAMRGADAMDDRLRILLGQLDGTWTMLEARLADAVPWGNTRDAGSGSPDSTLTDEEYFWEPVPGCWNLRPRGTASSRAPIGSGDWLLDNESPTPPTPPFTTIAWRVCHTCISPLMRYDYTFGSRSLTLDEIMWPSTAATGVRMLRDGHMQWRLALESLSPADLDQIGRSQFPGGLDRQVRFVDLLAWTNLEFAHHAAEIACIRDLYRRRAELAGPRMS